MTPWNPKRFIIWFYFVWPVLCDLPISLYAIWYIHNRHYDDDFISYKWIAFTAMTGVIPWLRVVQLFRFYVTIVLQTVFRTLPCFILMFIFCFIWGAKLEFESQVDKNTYMKTSLLAFKDSYSFTWGEDLSGWLD